jgi:HEPN domain-containing protein
MPNRAKDWLTQGERNLDQALDSAAANRHEWACFAAHQAAELAVKGLHRSLGQDAWGNSVRKLLEVLGPPPVASADLLDCARGLDLHYTSARYPDGHVTGCPAENYGALQSREAIAHARQIVEFCRLQMARP